MENFLVVQCVRATEHAAIEQTRTNTELAAQPTVKPYSGMGALRCVGRSLRLKKARGNIRASQTDGEPAVRKAGAALHATQHPLKNRYKK